MGSVSQRLLLGSAARPASHSRGLASTPVTWLGVQLHAFHSGLSETVNILQGS